MLWTDEQCKYLIDQKTSRNDEYWELSSRCRTPFGRSIAEKINECFGTRYTGAQVKTKWKNLLHEHLLVRLFKLITNYYVIINLYFIQYI
jgi:hypothetical protein